MARLTGIIASCVLFAAALLHADPAVAGFLYWGDSVTPGIIRAHLDGTGIVNLVPGVNIPTGLAIDGGSRRLYWTDFGNGTIETANLDGTGPSTLLSFLQTGNLPTSLALDAVNGRLYWAGRQQSANLIDIKSVNMDGTGVTTVVTGLPDVKDLTIDNGSGHLYWGDSVDPGIKRANLDGTGIVNLVPAVNIPTSLAIDGGSGRLFWTDFGNGTIETANLDGTGATTLLSFLQTGNLPTSLALDAADDSLYWAGRQQSGGLLAIKRVNVDGTGVTTLVTDLPDVKDLTFDPASVPEPSGIVLAVVGIATALAGSRMKFRSQ